MDATVRTAQDYVATGDLLEVAKLLRARAEGADAELAALLVAGAEAIERQDSQLDGYWYEAMYGD